MLSPREHYIGSRTRMHNNINRTVIAVIVSSVWALGVNTADAGGLNIKVVPQNPITKSQVNLGHITPATEGWDGGSDYRFNNSSPSPAIDIISKVEYDPYYLGGNYKGANSTSNYLVWVSGRGLESSEDVNLIFQFYNANYENNFTWKNLIIELYNAGDINDPANRLGVYDAKDLASKKIIFPTLSVTEGLSYQLVVKPRNYADFNLDN
jgi:hypothetical protein